MAQSLQIRRGTKAELDGITLAAGELGFTTDTDEVYVGDGSGNYLIGRVIVDAWSSRPTAGVSGRLFFVSSGTNTGNMYADDGSNWNLVGANSLDDISDGSTYGRVLNTYLDTNRPDGLWTGSDKLSASEIETHIEDSTLHRIINDSGTETTDLWSANKINSEIEAAIAGIDWQADVLDVIADANTTGPPTSANGDRYILESNTGSLEAGWGTISGVGDNDIVEFNSSSGNWEVAYDVSVEGEGAMAWDRDSNTFQQWSGTSWTQFGGASGVTAGHGINKDGDTIHVDPSDFVGTGLTTTGTDNVDESITLDLYATKTTGAGGSDVSNNPIYFDSTNGLNIKIDASTIDLDSGNGNRLYIPNEGVTETQLNSSVAGDGISGGGGSALSVVADSTGGANLATVVNVSSNGVAVSIDDSTIKENGSNQLYIPIDNDTLQIIGGVLVASESRALSGAVGAGLVWDSGNDEIDVNVGDGIQISSDAVGLKLYATEVTAAGGSDVNNNPLYLDSTNGLNVKIDSSSIVLDSGNDYRLTVGTVDCGSFV